MLICLHVARARAQETPSWPSIEAIGVNGGFGDGDRHGAKFYTLLPRLEVSLPRIVEAPLARYDLHATWVVEPFFSYITVTNFSDSTEAGANLLFFSLRYDRWQRFVPFIEGGEGAMYSGMHDPALGGHFQFSSAFGGGVEWFLTRNVALSLRYRLRHISNAGTSSHNSGLNSNFFLLGVAYHPNR